MANFIPTEIKTTYPLSDYNGNPYTLVYVGPGQYIRDQCFAICWNGEPQDYFNAEDIEGILSEAELRTTPNGNKRLVINW